MFNKFSIGAKLISGFSLLIVLLLSIALFGWYSMSTISSQYGSAGHQKQLMAHAMDLDGCVFEARYYSMNGMYFKENAWMSNGPAGDNGTATVAAKVADLVKEMKALIPADHELQKTCDAIATAFIDYDKLTDQWATANTGVSGTATTRVDLADAAQAAFDAVIERTRQNIEKNIVYIDLPNKKVLDGKPELAQGESLETYEYTRSRFAKRQEQLGEILEDIELVRRRTRDQALTTDSKRLQEINALIEKDFQKTFGDIDAIINEFQTKSNAEQAANGRKEIEKWQEVLADYEKLVGEQATILTQMTEIGDEAMKMSLAITTYAQEEGTKAEAAAAAALTRGFILIGIVACVALIVGVFLAINLTRSIAGGTAKVTDALQSLVNEGDITVQIDPALQQRGDEVGQLSKLAAHVLNDYNSISNLAQSLASGDWTVHANEKSEKDSMNINFNAMIEKINTSLREVASAVEQVNSGATQIAAASENLSQGATESAASIEEITASMSELAGQTNQNAQSAGEAAQLAKQTNTAGADGQKMMQSMISSMDQITKNSAEVQKVIKVIDDISFQTNLLALNAAVEAARAGQHGKGFAVVAEEVRNLAARCAKAAGETSQMIEGNNKQIGEGAEIATQTAEMLNTIVDHASKTATIITQIATASNEQAQGIAQVNQGLQQIDAVTQQNTASAEETASVSNEMSSQARDLQHLVEFFRLKGSSSTRIPVASAAPKSAAPTINLGDKPAATAPKPAAPKPAAPKAAAPAPKPTPAAPKPATTPVTTQAGGKGRSGGHINVTTKPSEFPAEPTTATKGSGWDAPVSTDVTISLDDKEFGKF